METALLASLLSQLLLLLCSPGEEPWRNTVMREILVQEAVIQRKWLQAFYPFLSLHCFHTGRCSTVPQLVILRSLTGWLSSVIFGVNTDVSQGS